MSFCKSYININSPGSRSDFFIILLAVISWLNIELLANDHLLLHQAALLLTDKPRVVGGISQMAALGSEIEKLTTLFIGGISPGVTDDQSGNLKAFEFAEYADADSVLRALRVLGGEGSGDDKKVNIKADENTRKYLAQYEASRPGTVHDTEIFVIYREIAFFRERAAARERERQREDGKRANRKAKAEKERERSHGRENRERANNVDKLKEKLKRKWLLKGERRWQHREETMATNREREAERDLDAREKQIRDREIMARKLAEWGDDIEADSGQEEYYKDRSRWWSVQST
ncbi:unnamed protein product [Rhizophagus irregularis]|nr:unnamed protein product [Rhizophagus irregularis]